MLKRPPYLPLIISLATMALTAGPAMATDELPAPPSPPPAQVTPPPAGTPVACSDKSRPSARIKSAKSAVHKRTIRGTASDHGCGASGLGKVGHVTVSVSRKRGGHCQFLSSKRRLSRAKSCSRPTWLTASGTSSWAFRLPKRLGHGTFLVRVRAIDSAGNVGLQTSKRVRIK